MTSQEKAERFAKSAPKLNQKEMEEINNLFPAYVFRRSRTREIWTSCCGRYKVLPQYKDQTAAQRAVMTAEHQREPKSSYQPRPRPSVNCPFCGRPVVVKEIGRTGNRDNLCNWKRALVLRWYRGALWGTAYDFKKQYTTEEMLTGKPHCEMLKVYRFRPGLAESTSRMFYGWPFTGMTRQDAPLSGGRWEIGNPFTCNAQYGIGYSVIGLEQIQKSPFRYCMPEKAAQKFTHFVQYLTACCFYPRQIEMLMKAGMEDVVGDLVEHGVKHSRVINWESTDTKNIFGLNKQDLKIFLRTNRNIRSLELYKRLKGKVRLEECAEWIDNGADVEATAKEAKKWNIPLEKLLRYLNKSIGCGRYGGMPNLRIALSTWKDYLTAAEALGEPIYHANVLMPKNLSAAHDSATDRHRARLRAEMARANAAREKARKERERLAALGYKKSKLKLEKKYEYAADGYLIRVPQSKQEIVDEGHKLQHCVAGYADRHLAGKVVILFMRKASKPDEPWITIEMNGNKLMQIHGFRNEGVYTAKGRLAPDPREEYREFLDTWLDWLKKGSKRNEDGTPKLPRTKKGAAA